MSDITLENKLAEELKWIDTRIEEEEEMFADSTAMIKLMQDENFQRVILEKYMEGEAERITKVLTTPDGLKKDTQEVLVEKLLAIRHLRSFIQGIDVNSTNAKLNIEELKQSKIDLKANPSQLMDEE